MTDQLSVMANMADEKFEKVSDESNQEIKESVAYSLIEDLIRARKV